jgi:hypothetical protein
MTYCKKGGAKAAGRRYLLGSSLSPLHHAVFLFRRQRGKIPALAAVPLGTGCIARQ